MKRLTPVLFGFFFFGFSTVQADQDGTSTAQFLRIGQGTRAEGMGGAFTAIADDPHAVYWNPAGLAQITRIQVAINHFEYFEDIKSQHVAAVLPVNKVNGTVGISVTYVDMGSIERRDDSNNSLSGDTDVTANAASLSWGQAFGERVALGGGVKFFSQDLAGETGSGVAGDVGLLAFLIPNRLALGASVINLGGDVKTGTTKESIPLTYRGGLAYYLIPEKLTFALDGEKERATDLKLRAGGEYTFQRRFIVRAGYQDNHEAGGGLSAGAGFIWRSSSEGSTDFFGKADKAPTETFSVRFDYGFIDYGDLDQTHRVGLTLVF